MALCECPENICLCVLVVCPQAIDSSWVRQKNQHLIINAAQTAFLWGMLEVS